MLNKTQPYSVNWNKRSLITDGSHFQFRFLTFFFLKLQQNKANKLPGRSLQFRKRELKQQTKKKEVEINNISENFRLNTAEVDNRQIVNEQM